MSDGLLLHLYCKNIPASEEKPFQLLISKQIIYESKQSIGSEPIILEADIPVASFSIVTTAYLRIIINEKKSR